MSNQNSPSDQRTLILMRHAKSDWSDGSLADHDRPLNARGCRDAPRMAAWLEQMGCVPDRILCSSSTRTRETAGLMTDVWSDPPEVNFVESLYHADPQEICDSIVAGGGEVDRLMVLAHNPGMTYLVSHLAGESLDMPTAAIGVFRVATESWYEMNLRGQSSTECQMVSFMRPKALDNE